MLARKTQYYMLLMYIMLFLFNTLIAFTVIHQLTLSHRCCPLAKGSAQFILWQLHSNLCSSFHGLKSTGGLNLTIIG
jgi:hypothetical protein